MRISDWSSDVCPSDLLRLRGNGVPLFNRRDTGVRGTWHGKTVLVTGVCGTVGRELLRQTVAFSPSEIIGIDNNESELFFLREEYAAEPMVQLFVGDIRDGETMMDRDRKSTRLNSSH